MYKDFVRSEPLDFSLQVDSPRYRTDRALALEVRYLRKDLRFEYQRSFRGEFTVETEGKRFTPNKYTHQVISLISLLL